MTEETIELRHKKFMACPCCNKPIKIKFRLQDKDFAIEPIHAFKCSECGKEKEVTEVYNPKIDLENPCDNARLVCKSCNVNLHNKNPGLWNRRGKKAEPISDYTKNLLKKMNLDD